jgi:octaprenyl-diphosphate synthase
MQFETITNVVRSDLLALDAEIQHQLSSDVPLVHLIGEHIIQSGGKRLRPLITLLTGHCLGIQGEPLVRLAAVIEFLHTATLLHDDVVDTSELRRGQPTANQQWGNAPSVLVGDFLYSRAFQMMVDIGSLKVMAVLAKATNVIAEGEVLQLANVRNAELTQEEYNTVIRGKTAMLFSAAAHSAAELAQADPDITHAMDQYGIELGMAFQIQDDILDYQGDTEVLGKAAGDDLAEGKVTLPLIYTLKHCNAGDRADLVAMIQSGGTERLEQILPLMLQCGALEWCRQKALQHSQAAKDCAAKLPCHQARESLMSLADLAVARVA